MPKEQVPGSRQRVGMARAALAGLRRGAGELGHDVRELKRTNEFSNGAAGFFTACSSTANTKTVTFIDASRGEFGAEPVCTVLRSAGFAPARALECRRHASAGPPGRARRHGPPGGSFPQLAGRIDRSLISLAAPRLPRGLRHDRPSLTGRRSWVLGELSHSRVARFSTSPLR